MNRSELHPVEVLILAGLVALEAAAVLIVALVALLLTVASWRPAAAPSAPSPAAVTEASILLPVAASTDAPAPALHPMALVAEQLEALPVSALRPMAGVRSKRLPKRELVALVAACC